MALGYNHFGRGAANSSIYTGWAIDAGNSRTLADIATTRKKLQVIQDKIEMVNEGIAPINQLMKKLGKTKTVNNPQFLMWVDDELPRWYQVNGAQTATSTALVLDSTSGLQNGMQLFDPYTRATIQIATVTNTTDCVIVSASDAIADDQELLLLGAAMPEGSTAPEGVHSEPAYHSSYTQTFRRSIEMTRRVQDVEVYGGSEYPRLLRQSHEAILLDKEATYLFGKVNASNSTYYGTRTKGLLQVISTNTYNVSSVALTEDGWRNSFLLPFFRKHNTGSKNLVILAGETVIRSIGEFALDRQQTTVSEELHGVKCTRYKTDFGEVAIINHGLFQVNSDLSGMALAIDLDQLFEAQYGAKGALHLDTNIETPGTDGTKSGWLGDSGIGCGIEAKHALMYGCV